MTNVKTRPIEYRHDDKTLLGELAWDSHRTDARPAILVVHEGGGINEHPKQRAHRLAEELGYVALACDMYGNGEFTRDPKRRGELMGELRSDAKKLRARAQAGLDALAAQPEVDRARLAAIGFCFGGMTVLELARSGADLAGVVSFHGILATQLPAAAGTVKAKILVCHGADDPFAPAEQVTALVNELRAAGADFQVHLHGGAAHGFTRADAASLGIAGVAYEPRANARSWTAMKTFFAELFGA